MKNSNDPVKQENKKALPKFIFMGVGGLILGVILGTAMVLLDPERFGDVLAAAGLFFTVKISPWLMGLGAFLVILFGSVILQQKLVDLTKQLYPEKQGSVYDTKFQKKWLGSCDEAERVLIGQCVYSYWSIKLSKPGAKL